MRYFLFLFFFYPPFLQSSFGQNSEPSIAPFPESWSGDWKGTLEIFNGKGKVQSVEMTLEIYKIDTSKEGRYTFGLVYGSKEQDWRPYELVPVSPEKGLWKVDEKNSISMESYLYGPKLLCWFTVQGSRVLCTYEKTSSDSMIFEVISGMETAVSISGNTKQGEEEIPEVKTFPCSVFQRAVLHKKE
ncbi:MAG: hypothetical protein ACKVT2_04070 [Saprospiraceae bacterium]